MTAMGSLWASLSLRQSKMPSVAVTTCKGPRHFRASTGTSTSPITHRAARRQATTNGPAMSLYRHSQGMMLSATHAAQFQCAPPAPWISAGALDLPLRSHVQCRALAARVSAGRWLLRQLPMLGKSRDQGPMCHHHASHRQPNLLHRLTCRCTSRTQWDSITIAACHRHLIRTPCK